MIVFCPLLLKLDSTQILCGHEDVAEYLINNHPYLIRQSYEAPAVTAVDIQSVQIDYTGKPKIRLCLCVCVCVCVCVCMCAFVGGKIMEGK